MKYQTSPGPSICIAIILAVLCLAHISFGADMKKIEISPFVDFDVTLHGGIGNNNFAFGVNGKTNLVYDCYLDDSKEGTVVDEYGIWTGSLGGIVYMGEMFYLSYMAIVELNTFHEETYVSTDEEDVTVEKLPYKIEDMNYTLEAGLRTDYHMSVYTSLNSQFVIPEGKKTRFQVKVGLKYHI